MDLYKESFARRMAMAGIKPHHRIALGVSGGPDSTALCVLMAGWKSDELGLGPARNDDSGYIDGFLGIVVDHKLRLCHGHHVVPWGDLDSLAMLQRQLDMDILVTGNTYQFTAYKYEWGVVINPGSATSAYSSITYDVNPNFVLMDINGLRMVVCVYELIDGEVKVDKIDFKKTATTQSSH